MNNQGVFLLVLQNGIGLNDPRQRAAVTTVGYTSCRGLVDASTEGIRGVFETISRGNRGLAAARRVYIPEQVKQRFYGLRSELRMRIACGATIVDDILMALTTDIIDEYVRKHNEWKEFKDAAGNMALPNVTVPKLTKSNWKEFSHSIKELLSRQRGTQSIPLVYVIRNNVLHNYDDDFPSTEEQLSCCLLTTGGSFRSDNSNVWSLLAEHTTATEAESIVQRYSNTRNGRAAWIALIAHMESTSYLDNLKSSAMASIASAMYTGEKKNFGIVKYFTIHSNAHNDLETSGEPLTDGMKITHFLQGLKEDTAMNFAISSKSEAGVHTFEEFYNSFSSKLTTKLTLTQPSQSSSQRHINALNTNTDHSSGRGSYRGRGFGRGGRGRGGRGRNYRGGRPQGGRYGGRNNNRYNPTWRPDATPGAYTDQEWQSLSYEQRNRVQDLRHYTRNRNSNPRPDSNNQRSINQVNGNNDDSASIPSQVQLPPRPTNPVSPPNNSNDSARGRQGRMGDAFSQGGNSSRNN